MSEISSWMLAHALHNTCSNRDPAASIQLLQKGLLTPLSFRSSCMNFFTCLNNDREKLLLFRKLDISFNHLANLPAVSSRLEVINVKGNYLHSMQRDKFSHLRLVRRLDLSGNCYQCMYQNKWKAVKCFVQLKHRQRFSQPAAARRHSPAVPKLFLVRPKTEFDQHFTIQA